MIQAVTRTAPVSARTSFRRESQSKASAALQLAAAAMRGNLVAIPVNGALGAVIFRTRRPGMGAVITTWEGAQPGDILMQPGFPPMLYTGDGWTSLPGATQASEAPQPIDWTNTARETVPTDAGNTSVLTLAAFLQHFIQLKETEILNAPGGMTAEGSAQVVARDLLAQAAQYCNMYGVSDCAQASTLANSAVQQVIDYSQRLAAYQANPSYATGQPYNYVLNSPLVAPPTGGGSPTGYAIPPIPTGGGPGAAMSNLYHTGGGGTVTTGAPPTTPADQATVARIENLSRPGMTNFAVGDSWRVTVTGSPNLPVNGSATHDGVDLGTTPFGKTDASGVLVLTGMMARDVVGSWLETWRVGAGSPASFAFTVAAPAGAAPTGAGSGPNYAMPMPLLTNGSQGGAGLLDVLKQNWIILAVVGALFLFAKK